MIRLDASVAAKLVLDERFSAPARRLYEAEYLRREPIIAPPSMPFEVANTLRQRVVRGVMTFDEADQLLADFLVYPFDYPWVRGLHRQAFAIAEQFGLDTIHDASYLALASDQGCAFWTDDRRLLQVLGGRLPFVRWIGELAEPGDEE